LDAIIHNSEALIIALSYGFGMLNLHRIELDVFHIMKGQFMYMRKQDLGEKELKEMEPSSIINTMI